MYEYILYTFWASLLFPFSFFFQQINLSYRPFVPSPKIYSKLLLLLIYFFTFKSLFHLMLGLYIAWGGPTSFSSRWIAICANIIYLINQLLLTKLKYQLKSYKLRSVSRILFCFIYFFVYLYASVILFWL